MQKKQIVIALAAASVALSGLAATTHAAGPKRSPEQRAEMMIKRLDTNGDRKVSPEEFQARIATAFVDFDADKNGEVTREEVKTKRVAFREARKEWRDARKTEGAEREAAREKFQAARISMLPGARGKNFAKADADKNGSLSKAEVETVASEVFKRRDKNADGFLDMGDVTRKI